MIGHRSEHLASDAEWTSWATCERVGCWNGFSVAVGRGRPRRYCSDDCRRQADTDRKRCVARIDRLTELLRREQHLLAAMGVKTTGETP